MATGPMFAEAKVEHRREFSMTEDVSAQGVLEVENDNGGVSVVGVSEGNRIRITGEQVATGENESEAAAHLEKIEVRVAKTGEGLLVRTVMRDEIPSGYLVNYRIEVPRGWDVRVANANGNVAINGVRNSATARVANGRVELDDVVGSVQVKVANGEIRTTGEVPASGTCSIRTSNGAIHAKLLVDPSASCDLMTINGAITLSLPATTSAGVAARTVFGRITVQGLAFAGTTKDRSMMGGESFSGTLGSGTGKVQLAATNGAIALKGF